MRKKKFYIYITSVDQKYIVARVIIDLICGLRCPANNGGL